MLNCVIINASVLDDENLIITDISIDDDFSDDVVIIVLKHSVSLEFITYTIDDFNEIDCIKVEDLTEYTTKIVKEEIEANKTGDYSKLNERISKNMLVNIDMFHRILCLYLSVPGKENVINAIRKLEQRNDIISAEPDYIEHIESIPNDYYYTSGYQWGLYDITATPSNYGISVQDAWNYTTGNPNLLVGVIDSGIDASHPDLVNNINDDLHRDYVDHPLLSTYKNVSKSDLEDLNGHGTHVAGIIGAQGNNSIGITGVVQHLKLVSLRVSNVAGDSFSIDAKRAIDYATDVMIQVLNYSIGGTDDHVGRRTAIQNYPGLFVCSAGNDDQDNDLNDHFPSNYNFANLIAVGAINSNGYKRATSNYGETTVDIFAPGGSIISTYPLDLFDATDPYGNHVAVGYYKNSGTSMAAPHVTGVAALLLSLNYSLTAEQLKTAIMNSAVQPNIGGVNPLEDLCVSEGIVNAFGAVKYAIENYLTTNSTVTLDCYSKYKSSTQNCDVGNSVFYKFNINCAKSYTFVSNASYPINMTIYDNNFDIVDTIAPTMTNSNCTGTITEFFNPGTYYLKINYISDSDSGNITTSYKATWPSNGEQLILNTNTSIRNHLHPTTNNKYYSLAYYNNTSGAGYYKITLTANANSSYPSGAIKVYEDSNRQYLIDRYDVSGMTSPASSNNGENVMYIFLPDTCTYYFEITMPYNSYVSLNLKIEKSEINNFDYTNTLIYQTYNVLFENKSTYSYFEEVTISHRSKFQLDISTLNVGMDSIPIYIFKKESITGYNPNDRYYCTKVSSSNWFIAIDNTSPYYTFVLEAGTYYFGYGSNDYGASVSFALKRVVDYEASSLGTLITDPAINEGYTLGSEVTFNNGILLGDIITEGFTRCIYLMFGNFIELPDSRLDYDWYSTNNYIATVTQYGTVLAKQVNANASITIYAVLKEDPSVVFSKQFTILNDISTDEIEIESYMSYSYSLENGTYQLELDNSNSPFAMITYYEWDIEVSNNNPNLVVNMNYWGYITSNGTGVIVLTGSYYLNPRVYLTIYLTITS